MLSLWAIEYILFLPSKYIIEIKSCFAGYKSSESVVVRLEVLHLK